MLYTVNQAGRRRILFGGFPRSGFYPALSAGFYKAAVSTRRFRPVFIKAAVSTRPPSPVFHKAAVSTGRPTPVSH